MTEKQITDVYNLIKSCQQAEDALSQGMDKLQQGLAVAVAAGELGEGSYAPQMGTTAMKKLDDLVTFVAQVMRCLFIIFRLNGFIPNFQFIQV